mmetsp:Transcript_11984/g.22926  ORF Transcript_11984/g.22926 Transcript_11984/m.22926 type:complete len:116 (-) Transcript_11984:513-860(-)
MGDQTEFEKEEIAYMKTIAPKVIEINRIGGYWQEVKCDTLPDLNEQAKCRRVQDLSVQYERDYVDLKALTKTCEYNFEYSMMDAEAHKQFDKCMEKVKESLSNFVNIYFTAFTEA